jgi:hypothetical protein
MVMVRLRFLGRLLCLYTYYIISQSPSVSVSCVDYVDSIARLAVSSTSNLRKHVRFRRSKLS